VTWQEGLKIRRHSVKRIQIRTLRHVYMIRPAALIVLFSGVMFSKLTVSVAVGLALFAATVRLPATPCFVTNTPSEKACQPGCCANKTCCATSHERTGPPVQPLAKSSPDLQNVATLPPTVAAFWSIQVAIESLSLSSAEWTEHSPPPLELICIRLI
jgi:hypothetical protein